MSGALLALDIDGTLCDSGDIAELFAIDPALWHEAIATSDPPPIADASEVLIGLPACSIVVVTARPDSLREATAAWLGRHFAALAEHPLLMRAAGDGRPAWEVKSEHLERVRGPRRVVLVDDDPHAPLAIRRDDRCLRAPDEWRLVAGVMRRFASLPSEASNAADHRNLR